MHTWADDDLVVVYNTISGDTHVLDAFALELIDLVSAQPNVTSEALLHTFTDILTEDEFTQAIQNIEGTLIKLKNLGLLVATTN